MFGVVVVKNWLVVVFCLKQRNLKQARGIFPEPELQNNVCRRLVSLEFVFKRWDQHIIRWYTRYLCICQKKRTVKKKKDFFERTKETKKQKK